MSQWHLAGEGDPHANCGHPQAYHSFPDGTRVWGPQQCGRRQCPICCDQRYLIDAADDITRTLMGWIATILSKGGLYDDRGRSLKVYHYIHSRKKDDSNLKAARRSCSVDLRRMGMVVGYSICHPYRGEHGRHEDPAKCRRAMDKSHLSIHHHGVALGYWSSRPEGSNSYIRTDVLADIRSWADPESPITLRQRLLSKLQYDIGHAGWYGDRGQSISSWGDRSCTDGMIPDRPDIYLQHPVETAEDGEPVWYRRSKPTEEDWEDLRAEISDLCGMRADLLDDSEYLSDNLPRGGNSGQSLYPWWHMSEIPREEWHLNWLDWRKTCAAVVVSLIR
jgi:hypothetical protein